MINYQSQQNKEKNVAKCSTHFFLCSITNVYFLNVRHLPRLYTRFINYVISKIRKCSLKKYSLRE